LRDVRARVPDTHSPTLQIDALSAQLNPLAFFRGEILVESVRVVRPLVRFPLFRVSRKGCKFGLSAPMWLRLLRIAEIAVKDGSARLPRNGRDKPEDETELLSDCSILIHDLDFFGVRQFSLRAGGGEGGEGRLHALGAAQAPEGLGGPLYGSGELTAINLDAAFLSLCARLAGADAPLIGGNVDVQLETEVGPRVLSVNGNARSRGLTFFPGSWFARRAEAGPMSLLFSADLRDSLLNLKIEELSAPGLGLSGEFRLGDIFSDSPRPSIALNRAEIDLERLYPILPTRLLTEADRQKLASARFRGKIHIQGASWRPQSHDERGGDDNGAADRSHSLYAVLDGVSCFIPTLGLPIENASGRISLNSGVLSLNKVIGAIGNSPISVNGFVEDLGGASKADLAVTMKARAADLMSLLRVKTIFAKAPHWLAKIQDADGALELKLDVKGPVDAPRANGVLTFDDFRCGVEGIPLALKGVRGSVRFEEGGIYFDSLGGFLGTGLFELKGTASSERVSLVVEAKPDGKDMQRLGFLPTALEVTGKPKIALRIEGSPATPAFNVNADLAATGLSMGKLLKKRPGTPLRFTASGTKVHDGIQIEEGSISTNAARIALKGHIKGSGQFECTVNLPPRGIETANLVPFVDPMWRLTPGGRIEGDAVISAGNGRPGEGPVKAELLFSHVSFHPPGMHKPMSGVTGRAVFRGDTIQCFLDGVRIGNSLVTGLLTASGGAQPKMDVQLNIPFLDTTDFTAPPGHVSELTWGEWIKSNAIIRLIARGAGRAIVRVRKGKTHQRAFSDFSADIESAKGLLRAPHWKMTFAEGSLQGSAIFDLRESATTPLVLEFQGDNLRMERILVGPQDNLRIESDMIVEGRMEWRLTASRKNHGISRSGVIEARLREGVIQRFEVLSKLFSFINLGTLVSGRFPDMITQGLPFSRMTIDAEVYDSKWKIKSLKLVSDAAAVEGSGMYFSDQDRVDFRVDVSPLVGFDKIISGLFGNLITRDGKTLTTTFRVRGLSHSPDVRLEPLEAFRTQ
jgi:hypothetical protein